MYDIRRDQCKAIRCGSAMVDRTSLRLFRNGDLVILIFKAEFERAKKRSTMSAEHKLRFKHLPNFKIIDLYLLLHEHI